MTACDFSRLDGVNGGDQLYGRALDRLNFNHMAIIAGFRGSAKEYVDFLSRFGEPLIYYGDNSGSHADHEAIHRVRYDAEASAKGQLHAIDGSLNIHSAQSLREPRPRYFCMLMVDSGWQDLPVGRNGESIVTRWSDALDHLEVTAPSEYDWIRATLLSPVPYPDGVYRSIAYPLPDARSTNDFGVRLKYDLTAHLATVSKSPSQTEAVGALIKAAQEVAYRFQLQTRELIILDNNRWGHGREEVVGQRRCADGSITTNPRELWSVTLA
jgi:alpha-ketoglutarate-dependent taurine dioxygenase